VVARPLQQPLFRLPLHHARSQRQCPRPALTAAARPTATFRPVDGYQTQELVPPDASDMCVIETLLCITTWRGAHLLQSTSFRKLTTRRGTIAWLPQRQQVPGYPHVVQISAAPRDCNKASNAAASPAAAVPAKPVAAVLAPAGVAFVAAAVIMLPNRTVVSGSVRVPTRATTPATRLLCAA